MVINLTKWNELSKTYQSVLTASIREAASALTAKYDAVNPPAMRRLLAGGAQLRGFSQDIMESAYKAANETYAEMGAANPRFKKILDNLMSFRNDSYFWWQIAELPFDSFQIRMRAKS